jgi:hypothetical protein
MKNFKLVYKKILETCTKDSHLKAVNRAWYFFKQNLKDIIMNSFRLTINSLCLIVFFKYIFVFIITFLALLEAKIRNKK